MNKIPVQFDKLDQVFHLADIHIRLFKRHNEYREVFETLYNSIRSRVEDGAIILVAGDILHAKLDMSPEMISLTSDFLRELATIAPTLITDGNHDLNLSNLHRMRSLEPIIKNIGHPDLHYLKDSGIYEIADTQLAVFSITDSQHDWPSPDQMTSNVKLVTYHGPVFGAKTDTNYTITSRHVVETKFYGFDIAMLGDIHKAQDISDSDPIIRYCGSLIQQTHGETIQGHGYTLWNIPNKTYQHVEVPNETAYATVEVTDQNYKGWTPPTGLPKNLRLRIFTSGLKNSQLKRIVSKIKKEYNLLSVSINPSKINADGWTSHATQFDIGDLNNINIQNNLIKNFLEANHPNLSDETVQDVIDVNNRTNGKIQYSDQSRNIHWKPIYFKFSNLFSFGENNYINFTKLGGTHGIFAPNASGKSSSMESLIFALFDKTPRAFRGDHIMNTRKNTFECELAFEVNGERYMIKRMGKKNKNGSVRVDVEFWKEKDDGTHVNLNGEDRFSTNANIRAVVGTYEDFILTTLSGQNGSSLFIDKSHTERKNLLNQFMGLNIFESLYQAANEEVKGIQGVLKKFNRDEYNEDLRELEDDISETKEKMDKVQSDIDKHERNREDVQTEIETISAQKVNVPVSTHDIRILEQEIDKLKFRKSAIEKNLEVLIDDRQILESKIQNGQKSLTEYNPEQLEKEFELYNEYTMHLAEVTTEYKMLNSQIENINGTIENLSQFKYNPDCEVCIENNKSKLDQIESLKSQVSGLREEATDNARWISTYESDIERYTESVERWKTYQSVRSKLEENTNNLATVNNNIDKYRNQITSIDAEIKEHRSDIRRSMDYKDSIFKNNEIDDKILDLKKKQQTLKKELDELITNKFDLHSHLKVCQNKKESIMDRLQEITEMEKEFEAYGYYLEIISRDGLPYYLISKTIPTIESEINAILSQIVPFSIALDVDGKNFGGRIVYDHEKSWPLENSSGMERFISSLAIRVALLRASNLPKSNFLIIDEGMGSLDTEYLHGMQLMFDLLKAQFDYVIIISHLDNIRDMVDDVIEITKVNGYSHINTLN